MSVCVVLDDDPPGTQDLSDVAVLLRWEHDRLLRAASSGARAIHLMTNLRAYDAGEAERIVRSAVAAVRSTLPDARIVLRGDSTLRGHVAEEYRAVREVGFAGRAPVLLLVPALPAAARITRNGIQLTIDADGQVVPLHDTDYARDGVFSYHSADLLEWADERSGGEIRACRGTAVRLDSVRGADGVVTVAEAILAASRHGLPAACVPDAETVADLRVIAAALARAEAGGAEVVVRCASTFAGVLAGSLATEYAPAPRLGTRGVLVVCGSYGSLSTSQIRHLATSVCADPIEADAIALMAGGDHAEREIQRVAADACSALALRRVAIVATPRQRADSGRSFSAGGKIADGLARVVGRIRPLPDVILTKGGITSQVVFERGIGAVEAKVVGPVAPGVSHWRTEEHEVAFLVFPGNVGRDHHLSNLVQSIMHG